MSEKELLEIQILQDEKRKREQEALDERYSLKWVEHMLVRIGKVLLWILVTAGALVVAYYVDIFLKAMK